jgi:hypothetical protein
MSIEKTEISRAGCSRLGFSCFSGHILQRQNSYSAGTGVISRKKSRLGRTTPSYLYLNGRDDQTIDIASGCIVRKVWKD